MEQRNSTKGLSAGNSGDQAIKTDVGEGNLKVTFAKTNKYYKCNVDTENFGCAENNDSGKSSATAKWVFKPKKFNLKGVNQAEYEQFIQEMEKKAEKGLVSSAVSNFTKQVKNIPPKIIIHCQYNFPKKEICNSKYVEV